MYRRLFEVALFAGLTVATAGTLLAQQSQQPSTQPSIINSDQDTQPTAPPAKPKRKQTTAPAFEHDPDLDAADQLAPSQVIQPMPGAVDEPAHAGRSRAANGGTDVIPEHRTAARISPASTPYVVSCDGVFGRELEPSEARYGISIQERHFHAGRCRLRWKDNGQCGVLERSEAAIGGVVVETIEPQ